MEPRAEGPLNAMSVAHSFSKADQVHLPGQPFASVEADLDIEGKPSLNTGIHETELGIDEVVVEEHASPGAKQEIQFFSFGVARDLVAHAGFNTGDHRDQAVGDTVLCGNLLNQRLLVRIAGAQVDDWAFLSEGCLAGSLFELLGNSLDVMAKIFEQNLLVPEKAHHSPGVGNGTQGASKDQSVESVQDSDDFIGETLYKTLHGVLLFFGKSIGNRSVLNRG